MSPAARQKRYLTMRTTYAPREGSNNARRGRPRKEIKRIGTGKPLSPDELKRAQLAFISNRYERAKMIARVRELTAPKSRLRRFMLELVGNPRMGVGWTPYRSDYFACHTPQKTMAEIMACSVATIKRMIREAVEAGLLLRPDTFVSYGRNQVYRFRTYIVCLGPLAELSDPTKTGESGAIFADSGGNSELSDPTIPSTLIEDLIPRKKIRDSGAKNGQIGKDDTAPKLNPAQRYDILQQSWQRAVKGMRKFDRARIRGLVKRLDDAGINWRGGREVYIGELMLRHPDLLYERIRAREVKLMKGSELNRGAIINAATEVRNRLKELRSMGKRNREQVNQLDAIADKMAAMMAT